MRKDPDECRHWSRRGHLDASAANALRTPQKPCFFALIKYSLADRESGLSRPFAVQEWPSCAPSMRQSPGSNELRLAASESLREIGDKCQLPVGPPWPDADALWTLSRPASCAAADAQRCEPAENWPGTCVDGVVRAVELALVDRGRKTALQINNGSLIAASKPARGSRPVTRRGASALGRVVRGAAGLHGR